MRRWLGPILITAAVVGCATSVPKALNRLTTGTDKDTVLDKAGNPTRTFRERGQDHWIYVYFQDDHQWLRDVIFDDGKVVRVTAPSAAKEKWQKDLEAAKSLEEYERKAREHQRRSVAP